MPLTPKEVRREPPCLQRLCESECAMRIQAPVVVGDPRAAESPEGAHQEQDQANQDAGAQRKLLWYVVYQGRTSVLDD